MWFQQDGATCHTTRTTRGFIASVISRRGDIKIMRFDIIRLFSWGYAKDRVYAHKHSTLKHLKIKIHQVMAEIPPNMCQKVVENYLKRINACNTSLGGHLNA